MGIGVPLYRYGAAIKSKAYKHLNRDEGDKRDVILIHLSGYALRSSGSDT
jgi:hypothetical protein